MDEFTYLEAYVSNLGKYTEGKPAGEWVSFPTTTEQMKAVFDRSGIDGKNYQEWHITEYKSDIPGLASCLGEYETIDELNYLGKLLEMQSDTDKTEFAAVIALGDRTDSVKDLINVAQNLSCYWIYPTAHTEEEYGQYLVDELETIELPEEARKYFDYEAYGRDTSINEGGTFTEYGYVMNNRDPQTEWYDGRDVPEEYRVTPQLPQPERPDPEKVDMDAAPAAQAATITIEPRPVIPLVLNAEKPAEKLKEITDRLERGISEIFESDRYKEYLNTMSKFHNYSVNNTILIAMQKPDASLIAGFNSWKNQFGRNVKKGEKGIKIIAPSPFKVKKEMEKIDPNTQRPVIGKNGKPVTEEQEVTIPAFKVVAVFDVSQTEGKELPDIAVDALTGDVDKYKEFFAALEKTAPVPVGFEKMDGGTHGYYHLEDKRIAIAEGMSELQTLKTTIHEIAHAKLHDVDLKAPISEQQNRPDRRTREVEAESIAYTVCQHYGLDTSDYSFGYVAGWSSGKELSELKSSLETIRSTAAELINTIDGHIAEIQKEQTAEQETPTPGNAPAQEQPTTPEYIYKVHANPRSDSRKNLYFLQAYIPQDNGMAKIGDILFVGTPEKCRELMGQLVSGELTQEQVKKLFAKAQEQPGIEKWSEPATAENAPKNPGAPSDDVGAYLPEQGNTFSIYQLKHGDETRDFRFEPYDRLQAAGLALDPANYEQTYTAPLENGMSLEGIFEKFNLDRPADFTGHSLSVSDVVVLHQNGQDTAHYVDSFGYTDVPEFLQPEKSFELQHAIDQLHKIHENVMSANPDKTMGQAAFRMAIKRLDKLSGELPEEQAQLKELVGFAAQSPDLPTLNERMTEIVNTQHTPENPLAAVEQSTEQNANMIDGVINNTPTVDELEATVNAGEQISLTDLAAAIKADKQRGSVPKEKPSIRAQLKEGKEKAAPKKATKTKNQDLEV